VRKRLRLYRRHLYKAGGIDRQKAANRRRQRSDVRGQLLAGANKGGGVIGEEAVAKERERDYEISRVDRFRHRTRYFTGSGIIGSKEYVNRICQEFKHYFTSRHEKLPKAIKGLEGVYSLKRLSETI